MKKLTSSTSFKTIIIEFFSIVLGVLLALGVNQWRENANNEERAEAALVNIKNEIESNKKTLQIIYENNRQTLEAINKNAAENEDSEHTYIPGIQLSNIAWTTMLNTGITNYIDYDLMLQLSATYSIHDVYKQTAKSFVDANLTLSAYSIALGNEVNNDQMAEGFKDTFLMLNELESQLIDTYEATLDTLENRNK